VGPTGGANPPGSHLGVVGSPPACRRYHRGGLGTLSGSVLKLSTAPRCPQYRERRPSRPSASRRACSVALSTAALTTACGVSSRNKHESSSHDNRSSPHRTAENLQSARLPTRSNWRADSTGISRRLPSWLRSTASRPMPLPQQRGMRTCTPHGPSRTHRATPVHSEHRRIAYRGRLAKRRALTPG